MRLPAFLVTVLAVCATCAHALYSASGPVTILNDANFENKLKRGAWLVEFYAPWCALPAFLGMVLDSLSYPCTANT